MNTTIDVKPMVEAAIHREWDAFAIDHPNLAKVLSEALIIETAMADLQQDAEYRAAMEAATAAGLAAETLGGLVDRLVKQFLRKLL